jgi:hypothetical protein
MPMIRLATLLPDTKVRVLRAVVVLLSLVFVALGLQVLRAQGLSLLGIGISFGFFALSWYLWRLNKLAMMAAKGILGLGVVISIAGVFNPFFAMDYGHAHGGNGPDWWLIAAWMAPWIAAALFCFWVLDRHKAEFR